MNDIKNNDEIMNDGAKAPVLEIGDLVIIKNRTVLGRKALEHLKDKDVARGYIISEVTKIMGITHFLVKIEGSDLEQIVPYYTLQKEANDGNSKE